MESRPKKSLIPLLLIAGVPVLLTLAILGFILTDRYGDSDPRELAERRTRHMRIKLAAIGGYLDDYRGRFSRYPSQDEGLNALVLHGFIHTSGLKDLWKRPVRYDAPGPDGAPFALISEGPSVATREDDIIFIPARK